MLVDALVKAVQKKTTDGFSHFSFIDLFPVNLSVQHLCGPLFLDFFSKKSFDFTIFWTAAKEVELVGFYDETWRLCVCGKETRSKGKCRKREPNTYVCYVGGDQHRELVHTPTSDLWIAKGTIGRSVGFAVGVLFFFSYFLVVG